MLLLLLYLSILFVGSMAQLTHPGNCPDVQPMKNFDINKFIGKWYQIERYPNIYEKYHKCSASNFTKVNNSGIKFNVFAIDSLSDAEIRWKSIGTSTNDSSMAQVTLPFPKYSEPLYADLIIPDTDYKTYAIQWICRTIDELSHMYVWIFSRNSHLDDIIRERINKMLRNFMVPIFPLIKVDQEDCPVAFK